MKKATPVNQLGQTSRQLYGTNPSRLSWNLLWHIQKWAVGWSAGTMLPDCYSPASSSCLLIMKNSKSIFHNTLLIYHGWLYRSVMALIHGVRSKFSCPICLVPHEQLSKTALSGQYEWCTRSMVVQILQTAQEQQYGNEKEVILMDYRLWDVEASNSLACLFSPH